MSAKADPKRLKRATAQLQRKYDPRRLAGFSDPRLSRADEQNITDLAHRRARHAARDDILVSLATITTELEYVKAKLGQVAPGDHRGYLREVEHGLEGLKRVVT